MKNKKMQALIDFIAQENGITKEEAKQAITGETDFIENQIETIYGDYLVLTDEEADQKATESILESLWAFNADFIIEHTTAYSEMTSSEISAVVDALGEMQRKLCESANAIVKALIANPDEFIKDAIDADGRGVYISWYDGIENEIDGIYIYRIN